MDSQEVSYAFLQAGITVPGVTTGETSLNSTKIPGLIIYMNDKGLVCTKGNVSFFVPMTNVKVAGLKKSAE